MSNYWILNSLILKNGFGCGIDFIGPKFVFTQIKVSKTRKVRHCDSFFSVTISPTY